MVIKKEVRKVIYLTKKERLSFQGDNFYITKRRDFLYLLNKEEFNKVRAKINNNYFGKEKRDICRIFFSKAQEASSKKKKIRIYSYLL